MKKITHTLIIVIAFLSGLSRCLCQNLSIATEPVLLPSELASMPLMGSSANGRYLYGYYGGRSFVMDTQTNHYKLYGDNQINQEVIAVSTDGKLLIQSVDVLSGQAGLFDKVEIVPFEDNQSTIQILSPDAEYPYFSVWYMTQDARYFCGDLTNKGWTSVPIIGILNEQGDGYSVVKLPVPDKDPLGTKPQQFRLIYVSDDGRQLLGYLVEDSGALSTIITYTKQADGSYAIAYPADDLLFDRSITVPPYPDYYDYVTVPIDPDDPNYDESKYLEQDSLYNVACDTYYRLRDLFSRNRIMDCYSLTVGSKGDRAIVSVAQNEDDGTGYPIQVASKYITVDLKNGTAQIDDYPGGVINEITPRDFIGPRQELLCAVPIDRYWDAMVCTQDDRMISLVEWIKQETGQDYATFYTVNHPYTGEPAVMTGWPSVTQDGKTITLMGYSDAAYNTWRNSYIRFGESLLSLPEIATTAQPIWFDGCTLHIDMACRLFILNIEGSIVYQCEHLDGSTVIPLCQDLPKGNYVVVGINSQGAIFSHKLVF